MTKRKLTKSDKARKLFRQGYSVVEVTKQVGMNYGHAYNVMRSMVLETEDSRIGSAPMYGVSESELASNPNYRNLAASEDDNVVQVLEERGNDYGDYASKAQFVQGVKYRTTLIAGSTSLATPSWWLIVWRARYGETTSGTAGGPR